ncbi:MAG: hypothetical protein HOP30_21715 [Cyclobacteriaceae bacterium]|nr:hypothetical protein [Cyclobacteriaceae bacterium]
MGVPKITLLYANGNLLRDIAAVDGIAGIVGTVATVGLQGVTKIVYNLDDAIAQGYSLAAEPTMYRHLQEFYADAGGNQKLYVMGVPDTMTLAQMVDDTNVNGAKKLTQFAGNEIRLLAVFRKPPGGYNGGANFIDSDVTTALTNSKVFAQSRLAELKPLRILIEGRVQNPAAANTLTPTGSANGFAGVVLGGSLNDGSASVGLALGRAVKYGAHIKLGKVANGPLSLATAFIGTTAVKDRLDISTLNDAGFITLMQHPQKAGFYFAIDRMASTDDYRLLAYGRVLDKAAIIAAAVYVDQLESEVEVDDKGSIATNVIIDLEKQIEQQINVAMGAQISAVEVDIAANQNIISTGKLTVKIRVRPLGYSSFIDVELGLVAS